MKIYYFTLVKMFLLPLIVFIEGGASPLSFLWAILSNQLIKKTYSTFEI